MEPLQPSPAGPQPLSGRARGAGNRGAGDSVEPDRSLPAAPHRLTPDAIFESLGTTRVLSHDTPAGAESAPEDGDAESEASVLGDFELLEKLGEGAMGEVWKSRQISFDRVVALKVLFPHIAKNKKFVERLRREGLALGKLEHPNIVEAYEINEAEGLHYVAMEWIDGLSLQQWLLRLGRFSVPDAVAITLDCARALEYAHGEGMIHRDIKPDNVLIDRRGVVKVADLGMVKTADEDTALTQTGHAVGTPWYMPLEQARMAKDADGRCDIYALGCMLYCLLTGNPPFAGRTIVEVIEAKEVGTFPPARSINPNVPERLDLLIAKMTTKLPRYRHQNCTQLIKDLESLGLAATMLSFLDGNAAKRNATLTALKPDALTQSVTDEWYVRVAMGEGATGVRKVATTQLKKMLEEGTVDPAAQASRNPKQGFRSLATFKEFQGTAFVKQSKRAADTQSARYRILYKKIEEKERLRDEEEQRNDTTPSYYALLLTPGLLVTAGVAVAALFLYMLYSLFGG